MLREFANTTEEGVFIANEIQRIVTSSDGVFGYGKCAILREYISFWCSPSLDSTIDFLDPIVRDNYVPKELTEALKAAQVPFRVLPELSPYERPEIKTLLAYVRLGMNSAYTPLLVRVLEGPHAVESKVSRPIPSHHLCRLGTFYR